MGAGRTTLEIADVFREHGETYRQSHTLTDDQLKVMRAIERCRTEALGGHLDVCLDCGFERPAYNSCRNRHCPKCQSLTQAKWIEQRIKRILPTQYFHVVFTIPASLRPLARANRRLIFDLLFASATSTLIDLGDDTARLGARLGITAVLHTWTRELTFHPHLHCIVTGGGLDPTGSDWISCRRRYLFPVLVLGKLFRGKFLAGLRHLRNTGQLRYSGAATPLVHDAIFKGMLDKLYATSWVVYAKKPFAGPEQVFRYLGRYTHRVGISNQRLQAIDSNGVRFATKGGRAITIEPEEFIRRFLDHVLPAGFIKIRHFGLHASGNVNTKLVQARQAIERYADERYADVPTVATTPVNDGQNVDAISWQSLMLRLTGFDVTICPRCRKPLSKRGLSETDPAIKDTS